MSISAYSSPKALGFDAPSEPLFDQRAHGEYRTIRRRNDLISVFPMPLQQTLFIVQTHHDQRAALFFCDGTDRLVHVSEFDSYGNHVCDPMRQQTSEPSFKSIGDRFPSQVALAIRSRGDV